MAKDAGCLNESEMAYDNSSRFEPKRSHQWFMDGPEVELFPNKKQAVTVPANNFFSGMLNSNVSPWGNASSFQSFPSQFTERLLDSDITRTANSDEGNIPSLNAEKVDVERKVCDDTFENDPSFGLSMSHTFEDPRSGLNYGAFRKVKVSQVKDSENVMLVSMGHAYDQGGNSTILAAHAYHTDDNSISMGLTYSKGDDIISIPDTYDRGDNNFISMGQAYSKGDDTLSMGQAYRETNNTMSSRQRFSKGDENIISMGQTYQKADDSTLSTGHIFHKGEDTPVSISHPYNAHDNNSLAIGHSYSKGESTIISFGGYDDDDTNPSGRILSHYELLMGHPSVQSSDAINEKELVKSDADTCASTVQIPASGTENISKKKDDPKMSKKVPPNNFPSNVRSLLSTGMLDGVPVKYIAWSREKELRGVIKGSGYLCGCQSCTFSKVINAYEFERHAGCKTKHPNNHIYFENGKTIYGIVQELRSTPQNMLFEVIQTITGSPINQKSFRLWKESFLAATRELQRIYGKDDGKQLA
ncbi:hypothetical protein CJ030_MR2G004473 [Morella rubra]|uniref:Tify domain-containing protein n=1 Tax=Morella rubra TaxID=262757 RepID=A0A6A1WFE5_9ROSI|nr:hypothetical protein CJ030_MR2G004473 [Morella rubra]